MTNSATTQAMARVRLGAWMMIAGTLGVVLALLTFYDVWNASDATDRPAGWLVVAVLCAVLSLAGFVVLWGGLGAGARARTGGDDPTGP